MLLALLAIACTAGPESSDYDACLAVEDLQRCWNLHAPEPGSPPRSLLIDLHGHKSSAAEQRELSGFEALADSESFVVAWPDGLDGSWNAADSCCDPASVEQLDDVGFLTAMVAQIGEEHGTDPARVYATGVSNGCAMSQRLAMDASETFAAVACMSWYLLSDDNPAYTATSVMELHGTADEIVSYEWDGSRGGAEDNIEAWANRNECEGAGEVRETDYGGLRTWTECSQQTEVSLVMVEGGGHNLYPGHDTQTDTTSIAWSFLKRFALDPGIEGG